MRGFARISCGFAADLRCRWVLERLLLWAFEGSGDAFWSGRQIQRFFRSPLNQRGTKKTWIWQGEKIGGGLDESGAQNQRTRSCLTTCYQQRRETYAGRCVTNRGERRGDCSEIYLHSLPFGDGLEGGEADGRRRRKQAAQPTTGEQAHRQKHGRTERWTDKRKRK